MTSDSSRDPRSRLQSILSERSAQAAARQEESPLSRLPRARASRPLPPPAPVAEDAPPEEGRATAQRFQFGPAFWTVTGIISLLVNSVLIALVIYLLTSLASLRTTLSSAQTTASNAGTNLVAGLYTNFEKMDRATIKSTIPVDAQIPLNMNIGIQNDTVVILTQPVPLNVPATFALGQFGTIKGTVALQLPAGMALPIKLDMMVPVQQSVPVHLDVPVNIPLSQTELHEPFTGLQSVVKPFYCLLQPNALNLDGQPVCR